jgi:glutaredoxin 3
MITVYGKSSCFWCTKTKELLDQYKMKYEYYSVDDHDKLFELMEKLPNMKTVPQIWWHDRHIGGYSDLLREIENTSGGYGDNVF